MSEIFYTPNRTGLDTLFTPDFSKEELKERRERIARVIGPDAKLLICGAPPHHSEMLMQDATFYYFTGLETAHSYIIVDGGTGHTQLFMPTRDKVHGEDSNKLGFEDEDLIKERLGFDNIAPTTEVTAALQGSKTVFTPLCEVEGGGGTWFGGNGTAKARFAEEWDGVESRTDRIQRLIKEKVPGAAVEDAWPHIRDMRTIKSDAEIDLLRKAGKIAAAACIEAMKACEPGMTETDLQAVGEYTYRKLGHCGPAYGWIVAGGKRTWDGHYHFNNATLEDDTIMLMDCGPNLRHYTSDIARVWPVNGTFNQWHRRVYGLIAEYHKALYTEVRPGVLPQEVYDRADAKMAKLCTEPDAPYYDVKKYFLQMVERGVGYLNHGVGMSVHDPMSRWKDVPLRENFVVVCDPMIWVEETREYIRAEDTLAVTADGCERLTGDAPFEINEIEALMAG